jgi:hypothetical protein
MAARRGQMIIPRNEIQSFIDEVVDPKTGETLDGTAEVHLYMDARTRIYITRFINNTGISGMGARLLRRVLLKLQREKKLSPHVSVTLHADGTRGSEPRGRNLKDIKLEIAQFLCNRLVYNAESVDDFKLKTAQTFLHHIKCQRKLVHYYQKLGFRRIIDKSSHGLMDPTCCNLGGSLQGILTSLETLESHR